MSNLYQIARHEDKSQQWILSKTRGEGWYIHVPSMIGKQLKA